MRKIILLCIITATFTSCKKNYDCTCKDQNGTVVAVTTFKNTKGKAGEQCNQYYDQHYGNIPFNQTTCAIN